MSDAAPMLFVVFEDNLSNLILKNLLKDSQGHKFQNPANVSQNTNTIPRLPRLKNIQELTIIYLKILCILIAALLARFGQ